MSTRAAEPLVMSGSTHDVVKPRTIYFGTKSCYEKVATMGSGSMTSSGIGVRFPITPQWHRAISKGFGTRE